MAYEPKYTLTQGIFEALRRIERAKDTIDGLPASSQLLASLRESARLNSTHYSTAIEGNLLSENEVSQVISGKGQFPNRQKDEKEVINYYKALNFVEDCAATGTPINEKDIQTIHGIAFEGRKKPTKYRKEQNVIRNGKLVVYIPPKAEDVPALMHDLVDWINASIKNIPVPIVAAIAHYQFATIHPYYDGNGRTARLLTTLILHKYGYSLKGIYSLEEYYAKNLQAYYDALTIGSDEDYYDGKRWVCDITKFVDYFSTGMAFALEHVQAKAQDQGFATIPDQSVELRALLPEQRQALRMFHVHKMVSAQQVGDFFGVSPRHARRLCNEWVASGFLIISPKTGKARHYQLEEKLEKLVLDKLA